MKNKTNANKGTPKAAGQSSETVVEVLYQKLGNRWFAFSQVGEEIYYGEVSREALAAKNVSLAGIDPVPLTASAASGATSASFSAAAASAQNSLEGFGDSLTTFAEAASLAETNPLEPKN